MTELLLTDEGGKTLRCVDVGEYILPGFFDDAAKVKALFDNLPNVAMQDDDIMLCSYPKTGTNWCYEILMMILNKSAKRIQGSKADTMLEIRPQEHIDTLECPRVLNAHVNYRFLPKDMKKRKTKTVLIIRNPKDTAVSYFNYMRAMHLYKYEGMFSDWLPLLINGKLEYGKYSEYLKEWEEAMKGDVGFPLHVVCYEDLKLNGKYEIERLAKFLGVALEDTLVDDIMDMCSFEKMKEKEAGVKTTGILREKHDFFRKGQVGDWKNWFTVAQSDHFEKVWEEEMKDSTFKFTYTGTPV